MRRQRFIPGDRVVHRLGPGWPVGTVMGSRGQVVIVQWDNDSRRIRVRSGALIREGVRIGEEFR